MSKEDDSSKPDRTANHFQSLRDSLVRDMGCGRLISAKCTSCGNTNLKTGTGKRFDCGCDEGSMLNDDYELVYCGDETNDDLFVCASCAKGMVGELSELLAYLDADTFIMEQSERDAQRLLEECSRWRSVAIELAGLTRAVLSTVKQDELKGTKELMNMQRYMAEHEDDLPVVKGD